LDLLADFVQLRETEVTGEGAGFAAPVGVGQRTPTVSHRSQSRRIHCHPAHVSEWTATARANAAPEQVLEVLTHPEEIRRWSPVAFDLDDLEGRRLAAGTRGRVSGRLAGVRVGFDVEVHAADEARLELSAEGPVSLDVRYEMTSDESGAELSASVSLRRSDGLAGRLVANATAALLSAGALEGAAGRIVRVAESQPDVAAA
jgi:Polyketide cyclase / dehydrase and lipid transport